MWSLTTTIVSLEGSACFWSQPVGKKFDWTLSIERNAEEVRFVYDVNNPDEGPERAPPYTCVYPSEARGGVYQDMDTSEVQFRQAFLKHITRELCLYFVPYSNRDKYYHFG